MLVQPHAMLGVNRKQYANMWLHTDTDDMLVHPYTLPLSKQFPSVAGHRQTEVVVVVQAQALDSACLAMLAEVMGRTGQLDTMEYLMAGMWILLRTPANRALLSTAFDPKKVAGTRYSHSKHHQLDVLKPCLGDKLDTGRSLLCLQPLPLSMAR